MKEKKVRSGKTRKLEFFEFIKSHFHYSVWYLINIACLTIIYYDVTFSFIRFLFFYLEGTKGKYLLKIKKYFL